MTLYKADVLTEKNADPLCKVECPCHTNCPQGCPCPGWQCPCEIRGENHLEHEKCKSVADEHQAKCLKGCHVGDSRCIQLCTVGYTNELNNCPCGKNCPDGCPCDIWECDGDWWETTPGPPTTPESRVFTRSSSYSKTLFLNEHFKFCKFS